MANINKHDPDSMVLKNAGIKFLNNSIKELNETGTFDVINSEAFSDFQTIYLQYKDKKKCSELSSKYILINYILCELYGLYSAGVNDFDRQSLKLSNLITDMYIIERDINKINYYKHISTELAKNIVFENNIYGKLMEVLNLLENVTPNKQTQEIEKQLLELKNKTQKAIEEDSGNFSKGRTDTDSLRKNNNSITQMSKDKDFLELIKIPFKSFLTMYSIKLTIDGIYELYEISEKMNLKSPYTLTSYLSTRARIGDLLELAFENESVDESFEDSKIFYLLTDYIDLEKRIKHPAMKNIREKEKELIINKIDLLLELIEEKDIDELQESLNNMLSTTANNIRKELRW